MRRVSRSCTARKIRDPHLRKNLCPPSGRTRDPTHVELLNLPTEGARILLSHPSKTVGGPHAPLRILLPRLQEDILKDIGSRRLRRRRGPLPAVWEQERRAALVRLLRYHVEEECLKPASRSSRMHFDKFAFGSIEIDGSTYEHDVVIDRGEINKRQEKTLQEIPRGVRSYGAVRRGKDTLEMSAPRGRNRRAGRASSDGRSQTGGRTAQSRIAGLADCRSHQGSAARRQRHERGAPRGVLGLTIGPGGWM